VTWTQLRQPGVNKPCRPGWCLVYVQDVFGIPAKQPSALADWQANTYNHADQDFPEGVAVPIWFSGRSGDLKLYGHVAVRMSDGSVWSASHPTSDQPMHFNSIDALNSYYGGQLIYLGWSEDVEDVLVIEQEEDVEYFDSEEQLAWTARTLYGIEPEKKWLKDTMAARPSYKALTESMKKYAVDAGISYPAFKDKAGKQPQESSDADKKLKALQQALTNVLNVK
jgi:hypothetical protein